MPAKYRTFGSRHRTQEKREAVSKRQAKWYQVQRQKMFDLLGGAKCSRCGFSDVRALQVDHVKGGGCATRRLSTNPCGFFRHVREFTNEYQVLCANCNWIKRSELGEGISFKKRMIPKASKNQKTLF